MIDRAYLPVGDKGIYGYKDLKKGDVVKLITGEEVVFLEMRRVKWTGRYNGRGLNVPIWRDRAQTEPFITAIIGRDESVIVKPINPSKLKIGDIFFIEGHKETFMFYGDKITPRTGQKYIMGRDLATGKKYSIEAAMKLVKVDLNELKKELISK
jgi:hypothetical protein